MPIYDFFKCLQSNTFLPGLKISLVKQCRVADVWVVCGWKCYPKVKTVEQY